ncbi:hybrid sensor histidine kinase/response regulator [Stakelama saccharophila]|uniref:histidine kinase n=1 Tax=Stakelama saccharophila TaxID=3075605 RepID=A0ABZ0B630_9SPHN|nr:PAS domain S-box protein [Stakelama sp. W311]WNO52713.1 PAS domain S-box protein [Stakelama sp. W311]
MDLQTVPLSDRFRLLVEAVTDYAIYMLDPEGTIITWNPGGRRFKGYEEHEIVGRNFSCFFTEEDREGGLPQQILRTAATEGRCEGEGWRVRKDGSQFWVHAVVDAIMSDDGQLLGFAKITRDITEEHLRRTALYESEQRFRLLVQGVHDYAIYMLDRDGNVTNWNSGAEAIKGYSADEIIGHHFSRFYTPEERERGEPANALATALREGRYEREAQRVRKDGTTFWAHVVLEPIRDEQGEHVGFAKVTRDITERRRSQEELEEARIALAQAQKLQALGELTGGIAHDFNNLMTVVRGSAELLARPGLSEEKRQRYVTAIAETADVAANLTRRLLAFGRRQALTPEVIDTRSRLTTFSDVLDRTIGEQVEVKLDLAKAVHPLEVDIAEFEASLLNAALNARDAMPGGGTLTISACNIASDSVRISIGDTGEGIPPDVLERVFEPFFTTKQVGKGSGLGLSQIHGFVAQSGGRVEIESSQGEGTTISLFLPASRKSLPREARAEPDGNIPANFRVLLVEDNDAVRSFAETLLREFGAQVTAAGSGREALELLNGNSFDLVFSDVVMADMTGIEMARHIHENRPTQRIVLATGYSKEVAGGEAAGYEVVRKPYGASSLRPVLARALASTDQR